MSRSKKDRQKPRARPPSGAGHQAHTGRGERSFRRGRPGDAGDGAATGWLRSKRPVLRLAILFCLFIGAFYACYLPLTQTELFRSYLNRLAGTCAGILRLLGHDVSLSDLTVKSAKFSFGMAQGCDGLEMAALFGAAVLSSPVPLRSRISFAFLGIVALLTVNVFRIVSMAYVDIYFPGWGDLVHWDIWPGILIVLIVLSWLIWARRAVRKQGAQADVSV